MLVLNNLTGKIIYCRAGRTGIDPDQIKAAVFGIFISKSMEEGERN